MADYSDELNAHIANLRPVWSIVIMHQKFVPVQVDIHKAAVPVKKPDMRGGVYYSEMQEYRATCTISDTTIIPLLTSTMLGPNTDFVPIILVADAGQSRFQIKAHLTHYIQTKDNIKLNMAIVQVTV